MLPLTFMLIAADAYVPAPGGAPWRGSAQQVRVCACACVRVCACACVCL
jgi:hypothetical protein